MLLVHLSLCFCFSPLNAVFIDGHERPDVIESLKIFLRKMVKIGFLHFTNAPTDRARQALPEDIDPPILERREKKTRAKKHVDFYDSVSLDNIRTKPLQESQTLDVCISRGSSTWKRAG